MGFKKYYVYEVLSTKSPRDTYGGSFIEVRSVNELGDEVEDFLFSDEHVLEDVGIGYWYVC